MSEKWSACREGGKFLRELEVKELPCGCVLSGKVIKRRCRQLQQIQDVDIFEDNAIRDVLYATWKHVGIINE